MRSSTMRRGVARPRHSKSKIERSSGNVFVDLGRPGAEERQIKIKLAAAIRREILDRGWSQTEAAEVLGVNQPKVSALLKYQLAGFSVERLMNLLTALGHDVEIVIRRRLRSGRPGRIVVEAA